MIRVHVIVVFRGCPSYSATTVHTTENNVFGYLNTIGWVSVIRSGPNNADMGF